MKTELTSRSMTRASSSQRRSCLPNTPPRQPKTLFRYSAYEVDSPQLDGKSQDKSSKKKKIQYFKRLTTLNASYKTHDIMRTNHWEVCEISFSGLNSRPYIYSNFIQFLLHVFYSSAIPIVLDLVFLFACPQFRLC